MHFQWLDVIFENGAAVFTWRARVAADDESVVFSLLLFWPVIVALNIFRHISISPSPQSLSIKSTFVQETRHFSSFYNIMSILLFVRAYHLGSLFDTRANRKRKSIVNNRDLI